MIKYILIISLLFTGINLFGQEKDETRNLSRKERKELERKQASERLKGFHKILEAKMWIIQATEIRTIEGQSAPIEPIMNYVITDKDSGIVQIAIPDLMGFGANTIGGVTVEGKITKYQLSEFKENKQVELQMQVNGQGNRVVQLSISIMSNGQATAKVYGRQGVDFIFVGNLKSSSDYTILKGNSNR